MTWAPVSLATLMFDVLVLGVRPRRSSSPFNLTFATHICSKWQNPALLVGSACELVMSACTTLSATSRAVCCSAVEAM